MKPALSIIIPCYNCEKTLREAVDSCFTQKLDIPFEVIMVDDGSTDNTKKLITEIAKIHSEIKAIYHEKNKGGGAARNTGINNSSGEYIICLDSDNFFDANSLQKMISFLVSNNLNGVVYHERRFFHSKSGGLGYVPQINTNTDNDLTLSNIFDNSNTLLDNFLYTRKSYDKTIGYPEHHGFDTQSYEMRYLSQNNRVRVCKDTVIYHRHSDVSESYFEREYNKGNFSINVYFAIEDIFDLFSTSAKKFILDYDIFKNSTLENNLLVELKKLNAGNNLFKQKDDQNNDGSTQKYSSFIQLYNDKKYELALKQCVDIITNGDIPKIIYFDILRCSIALSGIERNQIEKETITLIRGLNTNKKKLNKWYHKNIVVYNLNKIWNKLKK